ncbi:MAG: VWA domain-containing protein [Pirellulaceae bacterium]|nr:VWA domain-containing protein [Planctomycetales bacterium]
MKSRSGKNADVSRWTLSLALVIGLCASQTTRADEDIASGYHEKPIVQIAILLDNSGSMSGLIDQARSELWKIVNSFITAEIDGQRPQLQVALYHYGNPPATQLSTLTDDLDSISDALFGIQISGGSEFCGEVIQKATEELNWSQAPDDLKVIFIAGNEPFSQGSVDYRKACQAAIAKGIIVNTIHCGNGIPDDWRDGAQLADGKAMSIDHNQAVVDFEAPQDEEIARLGVELNKTYVAYGADGNEKLELQARQDANAANLSSSVAAQRGLAKANHLYCNSSWDLCDAVRDGTIKLEKLAKDQLPEDLRKLSLEELKMHVDNMQAQRVKIQEQINQLNRARNEFVAEKMKELQDEQGADTLDNAIINTIRIQAEERKFSFN